MDANAGLCLRVSGRTGQRSDKGCGVLKPTKPKKCRICRGAFIPFRPLQVCCSTGCAIEKAQKDKVKKEAQEATKARVEHRKALDKAKTRRELLKEAQIAINAYRRELTKADGCISCGTHNGKMNGGHYRSVGANPATRFEEINIWCQCARCNSYLSGNLINYRIELIKRIGLKKVEWLEGEHEPAKHTIPELIAIRDRYLLKLRELMA